MPLLEVILWNQENYKNFVFIVLKEYLFDVQIVFYYPKNFHLVHVLDEKLELLKSAGIVSMWMDYYVDKKYVNIKTPSTGPRIINVNQLLGGFEVFAPLWITKFFDPPEKILLMPMKLTMAECYIFILGWFFVLRTLKKLYIGI